LPEVGTRVVTLEGEGRVVGVNALKNSVSVELDGKTLKEFPVEEVDDKRNASGKHP
jgi:cell fate regulator YaaT (PSP1 superfamily)